MTSIALFNNQGGVGKTTLTYHLAHMLQRLGHRVLAVDLDPQADLTSLFLQDEDLSLVAAQPTISTITDALDPLMRGRGDIAEPELLEATDGLWLLAGDIGIGDFEDGLHDAWSRTVHDDDLGSVRKVTAIHQVIAAAEKLVDADFVLIDLGPNLGAVNRVALLSADTVVVPVTTDRYSARGLRSLGASLRNWRATWQQDLLPKVPGDIAAPVGRMHPLGYVLVRSAITRIDRPSLTYQQRVEALPRIFAEALLDEPTSEPSTPHELATIRNYRTLSLLSQEHRKPMFALLPADGALGSTGVLVRKCYQEFHQLAAELLHRLASRTAEQKPG
ncbi:MULTISPECIES: ParA family protein [unclassified Crossiella]|uniref:ParA family protein n=1 Tax=unclassified Crossiella TaxID=2620835 RepID=UPI001FFFEAD5|nr:MULTISPECIES: ParA family protein [unclassified Crossiella]MCK2242239.1 AAA family ATPase [Crossiella sp. S99.2]MCK2254730.1 AAA family ATPase [Crossiella sp. S99.1]